MIYNSGACDESIEEGTNAKVIDLNQDWTLFFQIYFERKKKIILNVLVLFHDCLEMFSWEKWLIQ